MAHDAVCPSTLPEFVTRDGPDSSVLQSVLKQNLPRSDLNKSQRAMIAASLATYAHGGDRYCSNSGELSQEAVGRLLSISGRSVGTAKRVRDQGIPELTQAVMNGSISVSAAVKMVSLPTNDQRKLLSARLSRTRCAR